MITVKSGEILDYYDGPLVFQATDEAGNHYIASAIPPQDGLDRYAVTAARPERLRELRGGRLGLPTLMLGPGRRMVHNVHRQRPRRIPDPGTAGKQHQGRGCTAAAGLYYKPV